MTADDDAVKQQKAKAWRDLGDAVVRSAEMQMSAWGIVANIVGDVARNRTPGRDVGRAYWEFSKEVGFRYVVGVAAGCVDAITRAAELKRDEMLRLAEMVQDVEDNRTD